MTETNPIYLDCNATTPLLPEVLETMLPYLQTHFGNPSSGHIYGRRAKEAVEKARSQVAALLGADAEEIFFTSGGTEANNLAIRGVLKPSAPRAHLITSLIEHPATANPCAFLQSRGHRLTALPVDRDGRIQLSELQAALRPDTALVTIIHANNETGVLQPIREIAELLEDHPALFHSDAAQSVGKIPIQVDDLGVDLLSLAGHKLYAPKGVGALYIRRGAPIRPLLLGAGHERGLRPGTENVASIVGLGRACEIAARDMEAESRKQQELRDLLWERLSSAVPGLKLNGHPDLRLPNTLNLRFPEISGPDLLRQTPEIAASTGSACHAGEAEPSPVILAMGVPPQEAIGSVRLSLGRLNSRENILQAAELLSRAWREASS